MATKAIHLELVSNLTSYAFIAALKRFISRRGIPSHMYSDNGTHFRRAGTLLHKLYKLFQSREFQQATQDFTAAQGVKWSFIPPSAPHFGGLWESGVKSVKFHMRRVIGRSILTFEEHYTILTQIEACLNSRPLFAMSNDSGDLEPLTPAHFLTGSPLTSLPEPDFSDMKLGRLGRWQLLQRFTQSIWKRWSRDYLHQLQQRNKWQLPLKNLCPGQLVLILDDNAPPLHWKRGVVSKVYSGQDSLVRVADVRTAGGILRRHIHKLCPLPVASD